MCIRDRPNDILVVNMGENGFSRYQPDLQVPDGGAVAEAVNQVAELLKFREIILDYQI